VVARSKKPRQPTEHCELEVLEGSMLVIDPSSGKTGKGGYAEFNGGVFIECGFIPFKEHKVALKRFQNLRNYLMKNFNAEYDVIGLELLKGRGRGYSVPIVLKQAISVFAACTNWNKVYMVSPMMWQAIAKRLGGWIKRDDIDAVYMGYAAIALAAGYSSKWKREAQEAFLKELVEEYNWKLDWSEYD